MTTIALAFFLIFFLWGFMPLRALFPYFIAPLLIIILLGAFLFVGINSPMSGF
jgi:hypothetical protein